MAYGNDDTVYEAGAPKKADVLIRSTQHIAMKQDELSEQTRQVAARLDEVAEQFSKNSQDSAYIVKQSGEIFSQLQSENAALKQELLYLAKQSENIYAGLAEKINELSERAKNRDDALSALTDRINDVSEHTVKSGEAYSNIIDKMTELAEQNKRNEKLFNELNEKLEAISEQTKKSEKVYGELSDKIVVSDRGESSEAGSSQLLDKINYVSEQLRRSEGAHSMLADKFEILSMRVEQFGFESAKGAPAYNRQAAPVAYPVPAQTEIDYDKLAEKIADIVSSREVVSPDYIASKVAEQVVIPEVETANVNVTVDTHEIAKEVVQLIDERSSKGQVATATAAAASDGAINEDELVEKIAKRMGGLKAEEIAPVSAVLDFDEDALAERIASKLGGVRNAGVAAVTASSVNLDEDELADSIALKVGSLKAEDFEILVDDEGCTSISKEIAENLDYNTISNLIADKLREALDLASVNAPDYEEMAERISEKITVAGINEAAIADKAAAALSNYLPEIDTDEIADKVTGAVIDVVSAIPQPTVDNETICNTISERLISSQEDHDYDIVIDDEGISKITGLVTEEIEKGTASRLDKVEEDIARLCELLTATEEQTEQPEEQPAVAVAEQAVAQQSVVEPVEETPEEIEVQTAEVISEADYTKLTELVAAEIEKGTASRFDKVEDDIAKLTELVSSITVEEDGDYSEEEYVEDAEDDYSVLSEVVATEIEKGVASRLDGIEENVAKITEYLTAETEEEEQYEEEYDGEETEEVEEAEEVEEEEADYTALSEVVAAEIEKGIEGVSVRLSGIEENVAKITEFLTAEIDEEEQSDEESEEADGVEEEEAEEVEEVEEEEADYTALSQIVAAEIEKGIENGVASRLFDIQENVTKVEESIAKLSEYVAAERTAVSEVSEPSYETVADDKEYVEIDDCSVLSEVVAAEIEKGVNAYVVSRLSNIEENVTKVEESIAKITEYIDAEADKTAGEEVEEVEDYATLSEIVATEIDRGISFRLDGVEENLAKLTELVENGEQTRTVITQPAETDYDRISDVVAVEIEKGMKDRFDKVDGDLAKLTELVEGNAENKDCERADKIDKVQDDVAQIKEMLSNGVIAISESAAAQAVPVAEEVEEEELVTVSDVIEPEEEIAVEPVEDVSEPVEVEPVAERTAEPIKEKETIREVKEYVKEKETVREVLIQPVIFPAAEPENNQSAVQPEKQPIDIDDDFEEEEEFEEGDDDDDKDDFSIDVLDMDAFSDDELMPGELSDYADGVDFANMMKFKRSFIARIIQSNDEYKQYYGEVKHALLSYKKVNSNVAWGAERFNKGRETIARMKIRGKTLCLYLALDPNNYKTSVYHHLDVSDNKSVAGTPMMVKIKSNLGVRKAIRLINEMLAMRNGERKEIPERDYAAMYPYETIEELIEEGLVKDVRKK